MCFSIYASNIVEHTIIAMFIHRYPHSPQFGHEEDVIVASMLILATMHILPSSICIQRDYCLCDCSVVVFLLDGPVTLTPVTITLATVIIIVVSILFTPVCFLRTNEGSLWAKYVGRLDGFHD